MPGKAMPIGPFKNGLNNVSTSGEAADTEVVKLINMEVALDGSLTSRAAFQSETSSVVTGLIGGRKWQPLCVFRVSDTEWYLIANKPTVTGYDTVAYLNGDTSIETYLISQSAGSGNAPTAACQYNDTVWFVTGYQAAAAGFGWKPGTGIITPTGTMPRGTLILSWKERVWISGSRRASDGNTIFFSTIDSGGVKPNTWTAADTFAVAPGDGGFITAMLVLYNNLIVFKNDGTWRYSYPSAPKDGSVDKISGSIGAAGPTCIAEFENLIYVYDEGKVYELINGSFSQLNRNVKFVEDEGSFDEFADGADLSIVSRRVVLRYKNTLYVFSTDTKSWSQWRTVHGTPGKFIALPGNSYESSSQEYIAATQGTLQSNSPNFVDQEFDNDYLQSMCPYQLTTELGKVTINLAEDSSYSFDLHFNGGLGTDDSADTFNIPVTGGQSFATSYTNSNPNIIVTPRMKFYFSGGSVSIQNGAFITAPAGAIAAKFYLSIVQNPLTSYIAELTNIGVVRQGSTSPASLLRFKDEYPDTSTLQEVIECEVVTKSYDYGQPSLFKRLFWWGVDIKAHRKIESNAVVLGRKQRVLWGDLLNYTNTQLSYGTWSSPLSFLDVSRNVEDMSTPPINSSENDRYFIKLLKALRFRQIYYVIKTSTFGNKNTGPVKLFTLTTVVDPRVNVVEKES